jgi:GAF domain-containing protein
VGALEVGQSAENSFSQHDLDLLQLVSGQAAASIRNALLYEAEQQRTTELSSLANLAQAVSVSQDMKDLFERLVKSVSPLFDVEILGFLLFDEGKRMLEGQVPFQGLPPHIVEIYRTSIPEEKVASAILATQEPLLTLNAGKDERWDALGIMNLAQAASLRDSALVPLLSGRRLIGFMQLSNHRQGISAFTDNELRLMKVVAEQATAIIENAVLVQQARQRAYRSDALRRVASLSASAASVDEVLEHSVRELAHLFQADSAAIFLLDEQNGELRLHNGSMYGVEKDAAEVLSRMFVADSQYRLTVSGSQKPFISGRLSSDRRVLPVYRPLITNLRMESTMVVPLVVREHSLGELMLGSRKPEFFNAYDLQVVTTAAGQLASALESAHLINQTDENLRSRVNQLTAIMRISRELNTSLDVNRLLQLVHDESLKTTGADCGAILLFDRSRTNGKLEVQFSIGCPVDEHLDPLLAKVFSIDDPLVVSRFDQDDFPAPHNNVGSALIVPIRDSSNLAGLIYLHARQPDFFQKDIVELVQTLAVQASIALKTASQYQSEHQRAELLRRRAETMSSLAEISYAINFEQTLEQQLRIIGNAIRASSPFQAVLFSVYEPDTGLLRRVAGIGFSQEVLTELLSRKQPLSSIQQLLKPEFRISNSYFIPADRTPVVPADVHMVTLDFRKVDQSENAWDPDDFLLVPLVDLQGNPLGLLSLDAPSDGLRPDKATIETFEIFAAQAALVINKFFALC